MARKPLCVATQHDLRKILLRSAIKKFLRHFFQKVATPFCNFLQTTSFAQILCLLTEQQIIGFRAACPMARKPLCVATQHDLRRVLLRSATKKFLRHFFQKVAKPNLCNFSRKRTRKFFFVTFSKNKRRASNEALL